MSGVTLHVNKHIWVKVEDRLLTKISQTVKGWIGKKLLLSFQQDNRNGKCCLISHE